MVVGNREIVNVLCMSVCFFCEFFLILSVCVSVCLSYFLCEGEFGVCEGKGVGRVLGSKQLSLDARID